MSVSIKFLAVFRRSRIKIYLTLTMTVWSSNVFVCFVVFLKKKKMKGVWRGNEKEEQEKQHTSLSLNDSLHRRGVWGSVN